MNEGECRVLSSAEMGKYADLVDGADDTFFYAAPAYHEFLLRILPGVEVRYLVHEKNSRLQGALAAFVFRHPRYGAVINSLPFYGSHGGVIVREGGEAGRQVKA